MALDNTWLDSDDWMQPPNGTNDWNSDDGVQELSSPPQRERPLPSSIRSARRRGHRTKFPVYYTPAVSRRLPAGQPLLPRGILTDYLASFQRLTPTTNDWLLRLEVAARADIIDEYRAVYRSLWRLHRLTHAVLFQRETGIVLPLCCAIPH